MMKKTLALLMALMLLLSAPLSALADAPNQIAEKGGKTEDEVNGVVISKTIDYAKDSSGNKIENYFDITLTAELKKSELLKKHSFDTELAIVLDISNTMNARVNIPGSNKTRLEALKEALCGFVEDIAKNNSHPDDEEGNDYYLTLVTFASDARRVIDRKKIEPESVNALKTAINGVKSETSGSYRRFTNIEGGLRLAYNNLADDDSAGMDNRFVMLMTDGFPTTYNNTRLSVTSETYIEGYNTYMNTGRTLGNGTGYSFRKRYTGSSDQTDQTYNYNRYSGQYGQRGFFANARDGEVTLYGTSYSDWGAYYAQQVAKEMKSKGINIFSVGVDIGKQSIRAYDANAVNVLDLMTFADVRRYADKSSLPASNSKYMGIIGTGSNGDNSCDPGTYENWLGNIVGGGNDLSGSSYYHLNTAQDSMYAVLDELWEEIEEVNFKRIVNAMATSDTMGSMVEFQHFFNKNGEKAGSSLKGAGVIGGEDDVSYTASSKSFGWNLGDSGYVHPENDENRYLYEIKYRVRLKNEAGTFVENDDYGTNDAAKLAYDVEEGVGDSVWGDHWELSYKAPAVEGYLGELKFTKIEKELLARNAGDPIEGAGFTLTHNSNCSICKAGKGSAVSGVYTNVGEVKSRENGVITFSNIPSGHEYTLTETTIPPGYGVAVTPPTWQVRVAYDKTEMLIGDQWVESGNAGDIILHNTPQYKMTHIQFQAEKAFENVDEFPADLFEFTMTDIYDNGFMRFENVKTGLPLDDSETSVTATNHAGENGSAIVQFPKVHFENEGTYTFTLQETGTSGNVIGDSVIYTITVEVDVSDTKLTEDNKRVLEIVSYTITKDGNGNGDISDDGDFTITRTEYDADADREVITFKNVHELTAFSFPKREPDGTRIPGVQFTLTHAVDEHSDEEEEKLDCNCGYTFEKIVAVSDANGMVSFENVPLGHKYRMTEVVPDGYKVEYPEKKDYFAVEVVKLEDGIGVTGFGENNELFVENIPQYVPELVRIHGMKDVHPENTDLDIALRKTNAFKFILTQITEANAPQATDADGHVITKVTVGNGEVEQPDNQIRSAFAFLSSEVKLVLPKEQEASPNGFEFPYIHINEPGTYVFTIHEEDSGKHGIDYDDTVYRWTIEAVRGDVDEAMNSFVLNLTHKLEKLNEKGEVTEASETTDAEELAAKISFENVLKTVDFSFTKASFYNQHPLNGAQFTLYHLHALSESDYSEEELQPETMFPDHPEDISAQNDQPGADDDDLTGEEPPAEEPMQGEMDLREQHAHDNCPDCAFYIANQTATAVPGTVDGVTVEGLVTFRNVPAGHRYLLVETKPPMDFDPITPVVITVTEEDGKAVVEGISVDLSDPVLDIPTYGKADLTLAAKKLVNGREPKEDQLFYFDLIELVEGEDGTVEEIVLEEAVTNDGSEIVFGTITYEWRDSYHYVIREKQRKELDPELGQEPVGSLVYDKTLYHVLVDVVVENGQLTTKVTYRRNETGKPEVFDPEAGRIPIFRNSSKPAATGDESRLALYAALALCCALAAVALRRRARAK